MSRSASELLRYGAAQADFPGWALVEVTGRHRERYLASQLTSDVRSLEIGDSQLSALLDASGRLEAFCFVLKLDRAFRLLVPEAASQTTFDRLSARVIADDVRISEPERPEMRLVLGPAAAELAPAMGEERSFPIEGYGSRGVVCWDVGALGLPSLAADELEARRVLSGLPRWGVDAAAGMLVNQTTLLDAAVSFTKGCYLGQETVAKLASHRGAAYKPVLLHLAGEAGEIGDLVGGRFAAGDRERAGSVLAAVRWEGDGYLQVALWRELRVDGLAIRCSFADGRELTGTVTSLPLLRTPSPESMAEGLYLRAVELFAADDEDEAATLLERSLAVCPSYADAYESLGVILGRHGRFEEAIELMQRLLEVDPDSIMAHTNMSVYHNQLGRIEDAEREARAAAAKGLERSRRAASEQAQRQREGDRVQQDRSRREEMFRKVLAMDADDALANFGLGQLEVEVGHHGEAVRLLERAIATDSEYSAAYLALGRALEGLGDRARARATYSDGIRVAGRRGDLKTANTMQERLAALDAAAPVPR